MSIADRLFARTRDTVSLATRSDTPNAGGGITASYDEFASAVPAKIVEIGTMHSGPTGTEQLEIGITHAVFISDRPDADKTEYVFLTGRRRLRVERVRLIGPWDVRFVQFLCEEIERDPI